MKILMVLGTVFLLAACNHTPQNIDNSYRTNNHGDLAKP